MKAYLAYILINIKLTWRDRMVVFFNYLFPLIFFFTYAQLFRAEQGGAINQVYASVLVIGVLGNGFFGGGIRAVVEREQNILRRFKVAPITPMPIVVSSIVVGLFNYLPSALIMFAISYFFYGMKVPGNWLSALVFIVIGTCAFRALGAIIASVANSMAESQIIIQLLYFPMMFLSGATFPVSLFPNWLQIASQFIPATYLFSGIQDILVRRESLLQIWPAVLALLATIALCIFISVKLFRWEKGEKLRPAAKLWIAAVLAPFFLVGVWQAYSRDNLVKAKEVTRQLRRSRSLLIENVRVFDGAKVIESGAVLIRDGRIAQVFEGSKPDAKALRAEPVEGQGKTLLPGLIDAQVLLSRGAGRTDTEGADVARALAAHLFSGVTAVLSADPQPQKVLAESARIARGERLGPDVRLSIQVPKMSTTRTVADIEAAIDAGASAIVGGANMERIPDAVVAKIVEKKIAYIPMLSVREAQSADRALLDRSLLQQVLPPIALNSIRAALPTSSAPSEAMLAIANDNLRRIYGAGGVVVAGSGAGNMLVFHGPAIQRELQLWVRAGIPAQAALSSATIEAAKLLRITYAGRIGAGAEASLLMVNGNPLAEIGALEAISLVIFKGERVDRSSLFDEE
ncbi:MAG: ABC transporter permease [Bryobacteraceae bacterium]|nr:ABC transporter permease [Bryobacteraceae bacterium]